MSLALLLENIHLAFAFQQNISGKCDVHEHIV